MAAPIVGRLVSLEKDAAAATKHYAKVDAATVSLRDRLPISAPDPDIDMGSESGGGGSSVPPGSTAGAGAQAVNPAREAFDSLPLPKLDPALQALLQPGVLDALRIAQHSLETNKARVAYDRAVEQKSSADKALADTTQRVQLELRAFLVAVCDAGDGVGASTTLVMEAAQLQQIVVSDPAARPPRRAPPVRIDHADKWCCGVVSHGTALAGGLIQPTLHCLLRTRAPGLAAGVSTQGAPDTSPPIVLPWFMVIDVHALIDRCLNSFMGDLMFAIQHARKYNHTIMPALSAAPR